MACINPRAVAVQQHLESHLGQVTDFFLFSESLTKNYYSRSHKGVCLASLVDNCLPGNQDTHSYLSIVNCDDESVE